MMNATGMNINTMFMLIQNSKITFKGPYLIDFDDERRRIVAEKSVSPTSMWMTFMIE